MKDGVAHILVADDDPDALMLMDATLRAAGYRVSSARDGYQALRRYREDDYDLVMLDVDMPGLDGYGTCEALRREAGQLLPIVIVTGMDDDASIDKAYQVGASDFIPKPISWALLAAISCAATRSPWTCTSRSNGSAAWRISIP